MLKPSRLLSSNQSISSSVMMMHKVFVFIYHCLCRRSSQSSLTVLLMDTGQSLFLRLSHPESAPGSETVVQQKQTQRSFAALVFALHCLSPVDSSLFFPLPSLGVTLSRTSSFALCYCFCHQSLHLQWAPTIKPINQQQQQQQQPYNRCTEAAGWTIPLSSTLEQTHWSQTYTHLASSEKSDTFWCV